MGRGMLSQKVLGEESFLTSSWILVVAINPRCPLCCMHDPSLCAIV